MNTKKALEWMSRDMDGVLSPARRKRLEAYLAAHPELRAEPAAWADTAATLRGFRAPGAPTPEAAWSDVRRAIRLEGVPADHAERRSLMAMPRVWAGALAAVMLMCVSVWSLVGVGPRPEVPEADVEMVETGLSDATVMVYTDTETRSVIIWVSNDDGSTAGNDPS
jgi:anti-sigma factor RsiW